MANGGLIVDNFCGGGGASLALEDVFGRVDVAINHSAKAVAMHRANHPETHHRCENIFRVDPTDVTDGQRVRLAHFSPDCTHHSRAKGGKPRKKNIRGMAWIVPRWIRSVRPDVVTLENVPEFEEWGPLLPCGRPNPDRKGQTFNFFVEKLKRHCYQVEIEKLRACDYGDPTIRERLFMVARCDGKPIRWPEPTHGPAGSGLQPYRSAAECIDWSIPCPSIFERKKPLTENTLARIARGIQKFLIEAEEPFIVNLTHHGSHRVEALSEPFRTITGANRGEKALVVPHLSRQFGQGTGSSMDSPIGTVTAGGGGKSALVSAFLERYLGSGSIDLPPASVEPDDLIAASHIINMKGTTRRMSAIDAPVPTVTGQGWHIGEVRAFLMKYYGTGGQWADCNDPMHTLTGKARMGLVTIAGENYQIVDIGMRMLTPRELFRAHSFPDRYVIDPLFEGKPLTKTDQIAMAGNSVPRRLYRAVLEANFDASSRKGFAAERGAA